MKVCVISCRGCMLVSQLYKNFTRKYNSFQRQVCTTSRKPTMKKLKHEPSLCSPNVMTSQQSSAVSRSFALSALYMGRRTRGKRGWQTDEALAEAEAVNYSSKSNQKLWLYDTDGSDLGEMNLDQAEKLLQNRPDRMTSHLVNLRSQQRGTIPVYKILPKPPKEVTMVLSTNIALADLQLKAKAMLKGMKKGIMMSIKPIPPKRGGGVTEDEFITKLKACLSDQDKNLDIEFKNKAGGTILVKIKSFSANNVS